MEVSTEPADLVVFAGRIRSMRADGAVYRSIAIRDGWIVGASQDPSGLDELVGDRTTRLADPDLTLLPAFLDSHEHLLDASINRSRVSPADAASIDELLGLIRQRDGTTPAGGWIVTAAGWNEAGLREHRLPTRAELDSVSSSHPILVPRGGHTVVANSPALAAAGISEDTSDATGSLGRDPDGRLNGLLEGGLSARIRSIVPDPPTDELVDDLDAGTTAYAAIGIGGVREALVTVHGWEAYRAAAASGRLHVRVRVLVNLDPLTPLADRLSLIEAVAPALPDGDDRLRLWGCKLVLDGGPASAAMSEPYADNPDWRGRINWDLAELDTVAEAAVKAKLRLGVHVVGDRALSIVLDLFEGILERHSDLPSGSLVVEHAIVAPGPLRARAIRLGIPITVQPFLAWANGAEFVRRWGDARANAAMPVRSWLAEGAMLAAGSDSVYPFDPLRTIWGFVTRGTRDAGVLGPDQAIDQEAAVRLLTVAGSELLGEADRRGTLEEGRLADIVAYPVDPVTSPIEALPGTAPVFTMVGGRPAWDPENRFGR